MKKTVQVNLSGQVFTLDEDAYELLSGYLSQIGRLYERSAGKDEILSDIESRIAELLLEKQTETKEVITKADVESVVAVMGRPEQFEESTMDEEEFTGSRNTSQDYKSKRLYRDSDHPVIGGVCSGIAYYFGLDPIWIRLAFGLSFVFFGSGLLLYIVLWIIIPEARTTAEKLAMKGEPVNIDSIGKKIESEIENFGDRVSQTGERFSRGSGKSIQSGIDRFFYFIAELFRGVFKVLGKVLGTLFMAGGLFFVALLIAGIFGVADFIHWGADAWSASMSVYEWGDIVLNSGEWFTLGILGFFLVAGIPFLALVYGGALLLFPRLKVPYLGASLLGLWFIGLVMALFTGFGIAQEFSKEETIVDEINLEEMGVTGDTITIDVGKDPFNISTKRAYYASNDFMMKIEDEEIVIGNVEFDVLPSHNSSLMLELQRTATAGSFEDAEDKAASISYLFKTDSTGIELNQYFKYPMVELLRFQEVKATLRLPEGKVIYLTERTKRIIDDIENVTDMYDPYMVDHYWEMREDGLTCLDCETEASEDELDEDFESEEDWNDEIDVEETDR